MNEKNKKLSEEELDKVAGGAMGYSCRNCGYCRRETNLEKAPSGFYCVEKNEDVGNRTSICYEYITTDWD